MCTCEDTPRYKVTFRPRSTVAAPRALEPMTHLQNGSGPLEAGVGCSGRIKGGAWGLSGCGPVPSSSGEMNVEDVL